MKEAVVEKASDIRLVVHDDVGYIEYRLDGDLYEFYQLSGQHVRDLMSSIYHSMCDVADETFKPSRSQDARLSSAFVKQMGLYGARVSTRPTDRGMMMVIRLLYRSRNEANSVAALRFFPEQIEDLQTMRRSRYGINIVSGATGSGKSLTLSVIMGETVEEGRQRMATTGQQGSRGRPKGIRVITIEDPPEYSPEGVLATPLNADGPTEEQISRAWSTGISDLLRKDPDVLMIGETRDQASAAAAYRAALTGHVAWTTLHTSDATSVPQRLIDLGLDRTLILDPMLSTGFVNQSLTKLVCPHCALKYAEHKHKLSDELNARIERFCDPTGIKLRGPGCLRCRYGTMDRVLIAETVVPTSEFMEIYRDAGKIAARKYWVNEMGGLTKCQALIRRIYAGEVDPRDGEADVSPLKISLALNRNAGHAAFVMIEEPENHLSHTSLTTLLSRIESLTGDHQQLFISTHSTFVLNRLGLDAILLLTSGKASKITSLAPDTVSYFQRLPGYDTLRMALAKKIVLVEGPSDEIVFEPFFKDMFGKRPMDLGIDVISMRGLSLARCLEFCAALDKSVAAMRDNDGMDPAELRTGVDEWLCAGKRELFIGQVAHGRTLEPQLVHHNGESTLRSLLGLTAAADLHKWMNRERIETAFRIASAATTLTPPDYMRAAATFIHG